MKVNQAEQVLKREGNKKKPVKATNAASLLHSLIVGFLYIGVNIPFVADFFFFFFLEENYTNNNRITLRRALFNAVRHFYVVHKPLESLATIDGFSCTVHS